MTGQNPAQETPATPRPGGGLAAAIAAFTIWGVLPLYMKPLHELPALEIMAHRIVWSCLLVFGWLAWRGEIGAVRTALANPGTRYRLMVTAVLISINWLLYVWSIAHGHVIDASLGYFINPLLNVVLGVLVLGERLNLAQKLAVGLAAVGVLYLAVIAGRPPWIALALAASFGGYGLIRKVVKVEAVPGLATETLLLAPFAAGFLLWMESQGTGALGHSAPHVNALLLGSGLVTALPLALFAYGARLIPLSTVGLVQYIGPTLQFLTGVWIFHEAFTVQRGVGFVFIWTALAVYVGDGLWRSRRQMPYWGR
ncbi:MAG: EamA family transporter RarD [Steroidobacteraceae bacterium]|nr:EamA family transporter RarD [Pseudomonadota bacterium]MBP6105367.1 EamA family transporter RarD [Steroidobacteraceae bacterium]MBP7012916.1 EamA family transporter RarD [Steroidobacteraceae bacterium]